MAKIDFEAAASAVATVKATVAALDANYMGLQAERAACLDRITVLYHLPLLREEAKQLVLHSIDDAAKQFPQRAQFSEIFARFAKPQGPRLMYRQGEPLDGLTRHGGPLNLADLDRAPRANLRNMVGLEAMGFAGSGANDLDAAFCFFLGDRVKERVEKFFDSMYVEPNRAVGKPDEHLTVAQRREQIAAQKVRVTDIDSELEGVVAQVHALAPSTTWGGSPQVSSLDSALREHAAKLQAEVVATGVAQ